MSKIIILIAILFIVAMWVAGTYNGLVTAKVKVEEGASTMDVHLKKRFDLVPNLVATVKGYAKHESEVLNNVIEKRNVAYQGSNKEAQLEAESQMTSAIRGLFAIAENYPDLKANTSFLSLQDSLNKIEEDIAQSREYYNGCVKQYNTLIRKVPTNFIATMFHFDAMPFFKTDETEKQVTKVEF